MVSQPAREQKPVGASVDAVDGEMDVEDSPMESARENAPQLPASAGESQRWRISWSSELEIDSGRYAMLLVQPVPRLCQLLYS